MATIQQIKQQAVQTATKLAVPPFWITDWLLYVIDKPTLFLITDENYQLNASESEQFNAGVTKMQQGIPLAYLTGEQEFWSLTFKVNEHTLIPRP
ncbi:MAG: peptide chain release factor N(5)-glutamine methyltransferase, partial [Psychrobacter sp.]|nr:peptide chain release factor N(5)-glutamine methyltransferase [Psychrobacter sp.]